ncbi:MAG: pyridoxamine 5'-phosphate oxidase family protein [Burkholderiales bacterium]|jgi:ferredoxin-NADP reductase/predicted pyridoxine 5'-phosphate oxidase superfamily flavin-nucleotide-binding protein|nr:pyridoxamine 5'-phosphate oxidase family protein [Burkholderiales bacterium]
MTRNFSELAFTPSVRAMQTRMGSRTAYAGLDDPRAVRNTLGPQEAEFIAASDGFFQATVGENGWPYVQHRGGPPGFLKVLDPRTIGYADFRGNVQYIRVGNIVADDRVSLIPMDYAQRRRLKLWGRARLVEPSDDPDGLLDRLEMPSYRARVERAVVIDVEAFDWSCPQHITPRFTEAQIAAASAPLHAELASLHKAVAAGGGPPAPQALGHGPLSLVVAGLRQLTPAIRAYELRAADGGELPPVAAGAHVDLPLRRPDGREQTRRYSIASDPVQRDRYEVAVLRETHGSGGSAAVHDGYRLGLRLDAALPGNDFALHADARPAVLIAGGIGITPLKAMAHALAARGAPFHLHYAARSSAQMARREELRTHFGDRLTTWFSNGGPRMEVAAIIANAPADAVFYVCGPTRLIDAVRDAAAARGVPAERVRFERFTAPPAAGDRPLVVELKRSGKTVAVAADQSILDAVQAAGVDAPAACRTGTCGTCVATVLSGEPEHRDGVLNDAQRAQGAQGRQMCICVSRARGDRLTLDL